MLLEYFVVSPNPQISSHVTADVLELQVSKQGFGGALVTKQNPVNGSELNCPNEIFFTSAGCPGRASHLQVQPLPITWLGLRQFISFPSNPPMRKSLITLKSPHSQSLCLRWLCLMYSISGSVSCLTC